MKINRETYEHFFIDYLDGNLSDDEIKVLIKFLDQNPDLEEELKDLTSFSKQQKNIDKLNPKFNLQDLKKESILEDNSSNFDELCISFYEGELNEKEEQYLLELAESREDLMLTFEGYAHTKAKADFSVVFPNKSKLKKHKKLILPQYFSYAASIILILGVIFYLPKRPDKHQESKKATATITKNTLIKTQKKKNLIEHNALVYAKNEIKKQTPQQQIRKTDSKNIQEQESSKNYKISPVMYSQEDLKNSNIDEPIISTRKGKLAYSNLSELEQRLSKTFEKKKINTELFSQEIEQIKHPAETKETHQFNSHFQLAISIDPIEYQKQILGSQPIK